MDTEIESVIVIGGSGFVGSYILRRLKDSHPKWLLHSISRTGAHNRVEGVEYHQGDVSSHQQIQDIFLNTKPTIIFHAAAPPVTGDRRGDDNSFRKVIVDGTQCVLDCARAAGTVKVIVFTSTVIVTAEVQQHMATESVAVKNEHSISDQYSKRKAIAEAKVLEASGKDGILTASLRLPSTYGEGDDQNIGAAIRGMQRGEHKVQIGDNRNLVDYLSGKNAAQAHVLAAEALLDEHRATSRSSNGVAGEAFFITDGEPMPFWDFLRMVWKAAGAELKDSEVTQVSPWFIMGLGAIVEGLYWIGSFGTVRPKALRRDLLVFTFVERTYSIDKARQRLGYKPESNRDAEVRAGVEWFLKSQRST